MGYLGSRDYPRLKQLLDEGNVIACFVDYNFSDNIKCRDIACAKKLGCGENVEYSVGVRGIGYSSVYPCWNKRFTDQWLYDHWEYLNLEFIDIDSSRNTIEIKTTYINLIKTQNYEKV